MRAWNLLAGVIDFAALSVVVDLLGVGDPERLVAQMVVIREFQREKDAGSY